MYRVVYEDKSVNASGLLAECISLEEAESICKKVKEYWEDVYIEEEEEEILWEKIFKS